MDFWKHYNARQRPMPPRATDHTLVVTPEQIEQDVMIYADRDGGTRVATLDHSRCVEPR